MKFIDFGWIFEDSKLWDIGERGFLPAVDPCKELPAPWDQLLKVADYIPSYAVQGTAFKAIRNTIYYIRIL